MAKLLGMFRKGSIELALIAGLLIAPFSAWAMPITGDLAYGGIATQTAGNLNFLNPVSALGTGDLAGIHLITLSPLTIPGPGDALAASTIWTDVFESLDYFTLSSGSRTDTGSGSITLAGLGTMNLKCYDPTAYNWNLSYDPAGTLFFFSASQVSVPEPATLLLLGTGLLGFGLSKRRRRT
jgi:PEP-CTERM motif